MITTDELQTPPIGKSKSGWIVAKGFRNNARHFYLTPAA
jgi:hypothetical protein